MAVERLLFTLSFITVVTTTRQLGDAGSGCTSRFLLPDRPFMVVWNHPSAGCEAHGIDLNLTAWDIVDNKKDAFAGDNMVIYYGLGHWPRIDYRTGTLQNGGVPQRGNLTYHLTQVEAQVETGLKPGFDGVAVIDMENWRPLFEHNFDSLSMYQKMSIDIVKARYPYLNNTAARKEAAREFDTGARLFLESTLNLTHSLTPDGHWGFYQFPRHWGGASGQAANDQLAYLWRASKGLFPEIYMSSKAKYAPVKEYIRGQVNETLRVWAKYSTPDTLILPYSLCQDTGTDFFSKENLTLAIGLPGKMGAAGVVLWGSTTYFHTHDECQLLQKYINTVLGPYVKNLTQFLSRCCVFYCSAHGRCVDKELEAVAQHERRESGQQHCLIREELLQRENRGGDGKLDLGGFLDPPHPYHNYVCRCLPGWTGDHCEKKL